MELLCLSLKFLETPLGVYKDSIFCVVAQVKLRLERLRRLVNRQLKSIQLVRKRLITLTIVFWNPLKLILTVTPPGK